MERITERRYTYDDIFRDEEDDDQEQEYQIKLHRSKIPKKDSHEVIKQGWGKFSNCLFASYSSEYLILTQYNLTGYSSEEKLLPRFSINFELFTLSASQISETEIRLSAYSCKKTIKIKFLETEIKQWSYAISSVLSQLSPSTKISRFNPNEKFWNNFSISEPSFLKLAENGDLLLFRGKNFGSKLQRCITRSKFDHVALVIKFDNGEVGFLEASRAFGVSLTYWDKLFRKDWKKIYSEIWYRKLDVERNNEMIDKLQKFVNEAKGKAYSLGFNKGKKKVKPGAEETFFCSELIASAYKVLGVLEEDLPSFRFYPSHFVGDEKLQMIRGRLEEEKKIDMNFVIVTN